VSNQADNHLGAGEYYGSVSRRRQLSGAVLSEVKHDAPRALPRHSHELGFFSFLLNGDYQEWYGRQIVTHQRMTLMWHPPTLQHQDAVGKRGCHFFNVEIASQLLKRLQDYSATVSSPFVLPRLEADWLMMRLFREFSVADAGCELAMEGLLLELLALVARHPTKAEACKPLWLRRVETRIHDEFTSKLAMTELAADANVHPTHLAVVFRRFHQTTIGEYVQKLRVQSACDLLRQLETPIAEIALQVGFADQSHFSRIFHRCTGMTPKVWRNLIITQGKFSEGIEEVIPA
jgi:AraC family transcriptional regulator